MGKIIGNSNHAASLNFSPLGHKKNKAAKKKAKPMPKGPDYGNNNGCGKA